jgi:hypothetical protein
MDCQQRVLNRTGTADVRKVICQVCQTAQLLHRDTGGSGQYRCRVDDFWLNNIVLNGVNRHGGHQGFQSALVLRCQVIRADCLSAREVDVSGVIMIGS